MTAYTGTAVSYPGFPKWEDRDTDPDILISCDMTSAGNVTASGGTAIGAGLASITYDSGGILLNSEQAGIKWTGLTTAQKTAMAQGGTFTCWIEKGFIDGSRVVGGTYNEYLIGVKTTGNYYTVRRSVGQYDINLFLANSNGATKDIVKLSTYNKSDYVRIDWTSHGPTGHPVLYVDYFPVATHTGSWPPVGEFDNVVLGGHSASPTGPNLHKIKNVMVSKRPIVIPVRYDLNISMIGHSYLGQGDYDAYKALFLGDSPSAPATGYDVVLCPELQREFNKRGFDIGSHHIRNHSVGGTKVTGANGMSTQIAAYKAHTTNFQTVICMWGANECSNINTGTWDVDYGTGGSVFDYLVDYKAQIDVLIAAGADTILIINQPYFSENHAVVIADGAAVYMARVDGCNVMHQTIVDYINTTAATGVLIDAWTGFGGDDSPTSGNWGGLSGTDWAHPNLAGYKILKDLIFNALY